MRPRFFVDSIQRYGKRVRARIVTEKQAKQGMKLCEKRGTESKKVEKDREKLSKTIDKNSLEQYTEKQKNVSKTRNKKAEEEEMKKKYERVKAETQEIATDAVRTSVEYVSRSSTADVEDVYDYTWMSEVE